MIHHHLIFRKLIISTSMRNEDIQQNLTDRHMMHHLIYNRLIIQT